jgi:hypothetical protein
MCFHSFFFDWEDCEAKAPQQIIFHFIVREFTGLQKSGCLPRSREMTPKNRLRLLEAIYNPKKYIGNPLGQRGNPS